MQRKDWLGLVAVHSDAWLMALAFYKGARLDAEERWDISRHVSQENLFPCCFRLLLLFLVNSLTGAWDTCLVT